jgi:hypothetical protein
MKKEDLCTGNLGSAIVTKPKRGVENIIRWGFIMGVRPANVKRIRLQCPKCGRRVWSSVMQDDGEIYHSLPPHKPKGWWKKHKRKKIK